MINKKIYKILIYFLFFFSIFSSKQISTITIPIYKESGINSYELNTKKGKLYFSLYWEREKFLSFKNNINPKFINYLHRPEYNIKGIKELNKSLIKEIDNTNFIFNETLYFNKFTSLIRILKKTNYIENNILGFDFIKQNEKSIIYLYPGRKNLFLGGISNELKNNKKKISFDFINDNIYNRQKENFWELKDKISNIEIDFLNGTKYKINNLTNEELKVEINDQFNYQFCAPFNFYKIFNNIIIKEIYERKYNGKYHNFIKNINQFNFSDEGKNLFPNIIFNIGKKSFILKKDNFFRDEYLFNEKNIFLIDFSCDYFSFGSSFLELFQFTEIDFDKNVINLYENKEQKFIVEKENIVFNSIIFIIKYFGIFLLILFFYLRKKRNNKIKDYYLSYFNEELL